jgi:hypothetical protein
MSSNHINNNNDDDIGESFAVDRIRAITRDVANDDVKDGGEVGRDEVVCQ